MDNPNFQSKFLIELGWRSR